MLAAVTPASQDVSPIPGVPDEGWRATCPARDRSKKSAAPTWATTARVRFSPTIIAKIGRAAWGGRWVWYAVRSGGVGCG